MPTASKKDPNTITHTTTKLSALFIASSTSPTVSHSRLTAIIAFGDIDELFLFDFFFIFRLYHKPLDKPYFDN